MINIEKITAVVSINKRSNFQSWQSDQRNAYYYSIFSNNKWKDQSDLKLLWSFFMVKCD